MEISKILQTRCDVLKRDPQVCARIWKSQDLKDLMQRHIKELHVLSNQDFTIHDSEAPLYASGEFPFCPQFTHFTAEYFHVDNSVPAAFMKAVKDGKFPNLKRIKLHSCTMIMSGLRFQNFSVKSRLRQCLTHIRCRSCS